LDRLNHILKERLAAAQRTPSEHPSADTLTAFAEQSLKAPQRETVLEHLAACADCRQAVLLATAEVPGEHPAPALPRKPVFPFPAAMRWASLAAAIAVAAAVGVVVHQQGSAPGEARGQVTGRPLPPPPPPQVTQESVEAEPAAKRLETKQGVLESSPAGKPGLLNAKKKPTLATSQDKTDLFVANLANGSATPSADSAANRGSLSGDARANQAIGGALVPNRESDQKAASVASAAKPAPAPADFPPAPAADAFSGGTADANLAGRSMSSLRANASGNQRGEVLQGAVTDSSGAAIAGADVTVTNVATGATSVVRSGANGSYRVDAISAGTYKIEVESAGFKTATAERVETLPGANTTQDFQLKVGASSEAVEVSAEAAPLNRVTSTEAQITPRAESVQIPLKTSSAASVTGSLRKAESGRFRAGIVKWAISGTGQLLRTSADGETAKVEPAPGMTVKAVASEAIEVWAAGTQSDLSVKASSQRSVLFHSSDAGKTWARVDGPWKEPITQLSLSRGALSVPIEKGIWTTRDGGKTWSFIAN